MLRDQLLQKLTVKSEVFELESFKNLGLENANVRLKELTISETKEFNNKLKSKNQDEAFLYACSCSMVEPTFFTDEELKGLNNQALTIVNEVISLIPIIGKTEEEKKKYYEIINEVAESENKEQLTEEEIEKK